MRRRPATPLPRRARHRRSPSCQRRAPERKLGPDRVRPFALPRPWVDAYQLGPDRVEWVAHGALHGPHWQRRVQLADSAHHDADLAARGARRSADPGCRTRTRCARRAPRPDATDRHCRSNSVRTECAHRPSRIP